MRHPFFATAPLAIVISASAVAGGCSETRTQHHTYVKKNGTQQVLLADEQAMRRASGVEDLKIELKPDGSLFLHLYVDEDNRAPGMNRAAELGYTLVTN